MSNPYFFGGSNDVLGLEMISTPNQCHDGFRMPQMLQDVVGGGAASFGLKCSCLVKKGYPGY